MYNPAVIRWSIMAFLAMAVAVYAIAIVRAPSHPQRQHRRAPRLDGSQLCPHACSGHLAHLKRLGLSQARFAHRFGFPVATLRHWEQGNRRPRGCALALLHVIDYHPAVATRAVLRATSGREDHQ